MGSFKRDTPKGFYTATVRYLYRGFFGICPVYISDLDTPAPRVRARHWCFEVLFLFSEFFVFCASCLFYLYLIFTLQELRSMDMPLFITGKLNPPKEFEDIP